jgi:hypothetical protein
MDNQIKLSMIARNSFLAFLALLALAALAPLAGHATSEQTFTRTINLHGPLNLAVMSGTGSIQISAGSPNQLRITGHVKANDWHATDDRLRDIAADPPIRQDSGIVRIGVPQDPPHVIIDYEIEAPVASIVHASSSLGDIFDEGVGNNVTFNSGSGSIHATAMLGSVEASSKNGDIEIEQFGHGDVKAISISGNLELRNLLGSLSATTSDGKIAISGAPGADWSVQTGKGDIDLTLGRAACNLDARSTSGPVRSDLRIEGESSSNPHPDLHHLSGKINGGGHNVTILTGDGEIRIH